MEKKKVVVSDSLKERYPIKEVEKASDIKVTEEDKGKVHVHVLPYNFYVYYMYIYLVMKYQPLGNYC